MKIKPILLNNCERQLQLTLLNSQVSGCVTWRDYWLFSTPTSLQHILQERFIVSFILFTRAKFSCCWFFRILITASAVDFFELPFAKVTYLWLDVNWRLLPTGCWSEFADRHMSSYLNALILWTYLRIQILNSTSRFEVLWNLLASNWPGKYKNSSWLINISNINACKYLWPCACSYVQYVVDSVHSQQSK